MVTVGSIAAMVIGLVGIIICQKKQKTNGNAQGLAFVFLILILGGAGFMLKEQGIFGGDAEMNRIIKNEIRFTEARSQIMADYIGKTYPGQKVVIITEDNVENSPISKAAYEKMQAALTAAGANVVATEPIQLPESNPENPVPMEIALTAKVYNDIFDRYKDANIFVIMSQLPFAGPEFMKLKCWKFDPKKQSVVLVNGEIYNLKNIIAKGLVSAAAAMKTGPEAYDPDKAAPKDVQAAFDVRYILVTPKNIKDIVGKNPDLFAK